MSPLNVTLPTGVLKVTAVPSTYPRSTGWTRGESPYLMMIRRGTMDCNKDGVTNCFDFMMVNGNGGYSCQKPLNRTANGRRWLTRYEECKRSLE
ncbi:unnamed protein product [Leptidea sinapis]|uniref:Uncharacterized protein n=1 Tax=Leptidea sinapis TaxID=189913 RepID=A0A5E4QBL0_9NEOP|nr:unnamed protein product [Leptidea sinapis]